MTNGWSLLLDLVVTLTAALVLGVLFERIRQNAIVGYVVAGTLVGPSAIGWVKSPDVVQTLSELGVALLLFTIGLEFSFRRLVRLGKVAFIGGLVQMALVGFVVLGICKSFGMSVGAAVALGSIAAISSTAVVMRVLKDANEIDTSHGKGAVGILLMQDILAVPLVTAVTLLGAAGTAQAKAIPIERSLMLAGGLVLALYVVATLLLPRILTARAFARNRELPILTAITVCMAATWGAHEAGLSAAVGAFLAGMFLAESKFAEQIRSDIYPLKTLFVTLFFAAIGMVLDVRFLAQNLPLVLGATLLLILGKSLLNFAAVKPFMSSPVAAIATGITLAQVGEISFVIAKVGFSSGLFTSFVFQLVICVSVLTLLATPALVIGAPKWSRALAIRLFDPRKIVEKERTDRRQLNDHVILVGYGEAGQSAADVLRRMGHKLLVMDVDRRLVAIAEQHGHLARIGDATQNQNLLSARLPESKALVLTVPDFRTCSMIIGHAKLLAPHVPVIVRSRYHAFADELDMTGADLVVDEESLVGERLGTLVESIIVRPPVDPEPDQGHSLR